MRWKGSALDKRVYNFGRWKAKMEISVSREIEMRKNRERVKVGLAWMLATMLAVGVLFTSIAGRAQTPQAGDPMVDGVWQADLPIGGLWTVTLKLNGGQLIGSISQGSQDPTEIYDGKVEGNTVVFKFKGGSGRTITFTGRVSADQIAFTRDVHVPEGASPGGTAIYGSRAVREFTVKRVAPGGFAFPTLVLGQDAPKQEFQQWARQHVHTISSVDKDTRGDPDLRPLRNIIGSAQVVAFGEPFHGGHEPLAMRNRLIRYAVTQLGFTAIALETGLSTSKRLYDHVLGKTTEEETALKQSFSYGFGNYPENLELIAWLRSYNTTQVPARRVRLYGIDLTGQVFPYAYRSVEAVQTFLDHADPILSREFRKQYADVIPVFRSDQYVKLTPIEKNALTGKIQDMVALIRRERIPLTAATSDDEYDWVLRQAVSAAQDDVFLRALPSEFDFRALGKSLENFQHGERWNHRQEMREIAMADNVQWVQQRESSRGGKILFFAANTHIQTSLAIRGLANRPFARTRYRPAGMYLRSALGRNMVVIGTYYIHGEDPDLNDLRPVDPAGMDGLLSSISIPRFIMDLRELPSTGKLHDWFGAAHETRWVTIEAPLETYDAMFFVDTITPTPPPPKQ